MLGRRNSVSARACGLKSYIEGITLRSQVVLGTQRGARHKSSRTPRLRRVPSETKEDSWFQKPFRAKHATARFNSAGKAADNTLAPPNFASPSRGAPFESSLIGFDNAARVKEFRLTQTRSD